MPGAKQVRRVVDVNEHDLLFFLLVQPPDRHSIWYDEVRTLFAGASSNVIQNIVSQFINKSDLIVRELLTDGFDRRYQFFILTEKGRQKYPDLAEVETESLKYWLNLYIEERYFGKEQLATQFRKYIESRAGSVRPEFMTRPMILGKKIQIILPNGERRNAQFAIVQLGDIIASHSEENFESSMGYPTDSSGYNINDRNYKGDTNAQAAVIDYAQNLEPERLITTSRTPSGTPVITHDGFVVSGNNRTMSMKIAAKRYPEKLEEYRKYLEEEWPAFGFHEQDHFYDAEKLDDPVLVRIDYDFPKYDTAELAKYNIDTKKKERPIDKAIKLSNIFNSNPKCKEVVSGILAEFETLSEFRANSNAQKQVIESLINCSIVAPQEKAQFFDVETGKFNQGGMDMLEMLLSSIVLDREAITISETEGVRALRSVLVTSLPVLMKNIGLEEGSLRSSINDAIILQSKIKTSGLKFPEYVNQISMFDEKPKREVLYMNRLLDSGRNTFKQAIEKYNAAAESAQGVSLFGDAPSIEEIFEQYIVKTVADKNPDEAGTIERFHGKDAIEERIEKKNDAPSSENIPEVTAATEQAEQRPVILSAKKYKSSTCSDAYNFVTGKQEYCFEVTFTDNKHNWYGTAESRVDAIEKAYKEREYSEHQRSEKNDFEPIHAEVGLVVETEIPAIMQVKKEPDAGVELELKAKAQKQKIQILMLKGKGQRMHSGGDILLAPNGVKSNLNLTQWKLVRTPEFKKWFGDWQKKFKIKKLAEAPVVDVRKYLYGDIEKLDLSDHYATRKYYTRIFNNQVTKNIDSGLEISISDKGVKKILSHNAQRIYHHYLNAIDGLVANAILVTSEQNIERKTQFEIPFYLYFMCPVISHIGEQRCVYMVVEKTKRYGYKLYDITLIQKSKSELVSTWSRLSKPEALASPDLQSKYTKVYHILQEDEGNISKVVDENGEPLVVYHYTNAKNIREFYPFAQELLTGNKSKKEVEDIISKWKNSKSISLMDFRAGTFFTPKRGAYSSYGGIEYACFLKGDFILNTGDFNKGEKYIGTPSMKSPIWYYWNDLVPEIVALYPEQIKLADGTNTTFDGSNPDIRFGDGGELDDHKQTYDKWKTLVNMSKSELQKFYNQKEGKEAGLTALEAKEQGIDSGRESARWIMKMKDTPVSDWTPAMWRWAKKQISFISRMRGNKGGLYDGSGKRTRKHTSLLIWGHNPIKSK